MSSPDYTNGPGYPQGNTGYPPGPGQPPGYPPSQGHPGYPGAHNYPGGPGGPPQNSSKTPLIVAGAVVLLALIGAGVFLASGSDDGPSDYAASQPAVAPSAAPTTGSDVGTQGTSAAAPPTADPSPAASAPQPAASAPQPAAARSSSGGGSYTVGIAPGNYSGGVDATGLRQMCNTYDQTSVSRYQGLMVCYNIEMQQHRDGSLQGTGYKSWEVLAGTSGRDLGPSEQSPIRLSGYIDNSNTIRLEYTVQGAERTTRGVATYDATRTVFNPNGGNEDYPGAFRTDAANASGSSTFSSYALRD